MSNPSRPIVVTHAGALKFAVDIGGHSLVVDQPRSGGGEDAGPAPLDLLGAALGTCVAFYVHQFCVSRAMSDDGLRVEVVQHKAVSPSRVGEFVVRVVMPGDVPETVMQLLDRVAKSCPAHNTLTHGATVSIGVAKSEMAAVGG